jgi:hypothetical protein
MEISSFSATKEWDIETAHHTLCNLSVPLTSANVKALKELTIKASDTVAGMDFYVIEPNNFNAIARAQITNSDEATITWMYNRTIEDFMGCSTVVLELGGVTYPVFTGTITIEFSYYDYNYYTWTGTATLSSATSTPTVTSNDYFPSEWIECLDTFNVDISSSAPALIGFYVYAGSKSIGDGMISSGGTHASTSITNGNDNYIARNYLHDLNQIKLSASQGSFPSGTVTVSVDYKKSPKKHFRVYKQNGNIDWCTAWHYNGTSFERCDPKYYNGSAWKNCI